MGHGFAQVAQVGYRVAKTAAGGDGAGHEGLGRVDAGRAAQFHPRAHHGQTETAAHPGFRLLGQFERRVHSVGQQVAQGVSANAPHVGQGKESERLASFLVGVDEANGAIALVLLGKLAAHFGKRLGRCDAHAHRYARAAVYLADDVAYEPLEAGRRFARAAIWLGLTQTLVALQITKTLVDAIGLDIVNVATQNAVDAARHGGIEHQIARKHAHTATSHDIAHLKQRIAALESQRLGLGSERHDATVVVGQHTDGHTAQAGVKNPLDRAEKTVAIN